MPIERSRTHPIRLHLDTSDYSLMYRADPGSAPARIRDALKTMVSRGQIEIGLSYHVVFELLQKAAPEFREDRLERARLLTELCERNAFPYPTELGQGSQFSREGLWVPRTDLDGIEVEHIVAHLTRSMADHSKLNRHERRVLSKRKCLPRWVGSNAESFERLAEDFWPLRFAKSFVKDGDLVRYISGDLTREEANRKLQFYITDPASVYEIWFEQYGRDDPIAERRDQIAEKFVIMLREIQSILERTTTIRADINDALRADRNDELSAEGRKVLKNLTTDIGTFLSEMTSPLELSKQVPIWKERFGDQAALVAAQILYAFVREKRPIKQSDGIDFVHAMYLPYTDLWRGDKAFSDLLIKHRVNFSDRVVSTLAELPERIEIELGKVLGGSGR
jgi:hypothetical protein